MDNEHSDSHLGMVKHLKGLYLAHALLDLSMIRLNTIGETFRRSNSSSAKVLRLFRFLNCEVIRAMLIESQLRYTTPTDSSGLAEKPPGGHLIPFCTQQEIDSVPMAIHGLIEIRPFPFDATVRFIHRPGGANS